jgi:hypothetical protein
MQRTPEVRKVAAPPGVGAFPRAIRRLTDTLFDMAEKIDGPPSRGRSLTQVLAAEKVIEKGRLT